MSLLPAVWIPRLWTAPVLDSSIPVIERLTTRPSQERRHRERAAQHRQGVTHIRVAVALAALVAFVNLGGSHWLLRVPSLGGSYESVVPMPVTSSPAQLGVTPAPTQRSIVPRVASGITGVRVGRAVMHPCRLTPSGARLESSPARLLARVRGELRCSGGGSTTHVRAASSSSRATTVRSLRPSRLLIYVHGGHRPTKSV